MKSSAFSMMVLLVFSVFALFSFDDGKVVNTPALVECLETPVRTDQETEISVAPGFSVSLFASIDKPASLALPPSNSPFGTDLFVANGTLEFDIGPPDTIVKVSSSGVSTFATLTAESDPFGGLEFAPGGTSPFGYYLYVSANNLDFGQPGDYGGSILRVDENGVWTFLTPSSPPCILGEPNAMAFGPNEAFGSDMFVADDNDLPGSIVSLNGTGAISKVWLPTGSSVWGVQFGPGGSFGTDLYYLESSLKTILILNSVGTSTPFVDLPSQYEYSCSTLRFSEDGAFGTALFVAAVNTLTDRVSILRISADRTIDVFASGFLGITSPDFPPPSVALPDILEFSDNGNALYVADYDGNALYEIAPERSGTRDWPMFRHDAAHTGFSSSEAPHTNETLWSYQTGSFVESSPAVSEDRVFIGDMGSQFYALNASTGAQLWNYTTGGTFSSPAVANGLVFVGSFDGRIYALNGSTGKQAWNHTLGSDMLMSSPTVAYGLVFMGSDDKNVYALNETTGAEVWSYSTGSFVSSSAAVTDGVVFIGSYDDRVYALNATSGKQVWNYTTGAHVDCSPTVGGGMVFVGSEDFHVYALNETTGRQVWNYSAGAMVESSPAVHGGLVFIGSDGSAFYALNASTGEQIWNCTVGRCPSSPAVADGLVFVGSMDLGVYALNESTGEVVWNYATGSSVWSSPAISDGRLFIGCDDHRVYAFQTPIHDVSVENVETMKKGCVPRPTVCRGRTALVFATVRNEGDSTETFNVTAYANSTIRIEQRNLTLAPGETKRANFTWDTYGLVEYCNYTVSVVADQVNHENDTLDNTCVGDTVTITHMGDITGDGKVDIQDLSRVEAAFGSIRVDDPADPKCGQYWHPPRIPPCPTCPHSPNTDISGDGKVDAVKDLAFTSAYFGWHR